MENVNIQTMAYKSKNKKLKKHEAQNLIEKQFNGETLSKEALADLYRFFTPAPSKLAKNDIEWVFKATGKEEVRPQLHFSYSDGKNLVATCGPRMHWIENLNMEKGFYDAKGNKIDIDLTFPDYQRVIPDHTNKPFKTYNVDNLQVIKHEHFNGAFCYEIENILYQKAYVDDMLNGSKTFSFWTEDNTTAGVFIIENRKTLIMPIMR